MKHLIAIAMLLSPMAAEAKPKTTPRDPNVTLSGLIIIRPFRGGL